MVISDWTCAQREALQWLEENRRALSADHQTIWNFHEPSWREYRSSRWYMDRLEREGFQVERGTAGMPTAFRARWSSGPGPVIADGMLYVMSGYLGSLGGSNANVLLAFSIDGK